MPVFALGRAQELLLILEDYWHTHPEVLDLAGRPHGVTASCLLVMLCLQVQKYPIYYFSAMAQKSMKVVSVLPM